MLEFQPVTLETVAQISPYFARQPYRTCDFTVGGLFMWAPYFNYEYAIYRDTLFIKGSEEEHMQVTSFALPIGALPPGESLALLGRYCLDKEMPLVLSAVPEKAALELQRRFSAKTEALRDWGDYLYDAQALATLAGRKYNKKRNHVNKFRNTYPDFEYMRISERNLREAVAFFREFRLAVEKSTPLFEYEESMVEVVLDAYDRFGFEGALLKVDGRVVALTVGEIVQDTLFVHIEKGLRAYDGVYETINQAFVRDVSERYSQVAYVNREEDVGDEGLRRAKLSYNPVAVLNKYNVSVDAEKAYRAG
ncbi:MAG: phosphatidylglycerol lysyltransferase domain-containing protein [Parabacteroides sp.]|nr:phosphatidylglycerol lysyltransferase domain-containing protein [Parabacteroides sp.]